MTAVWLSIPLMAGETMYKKLLDDIDMLDGVITPPDIDRIQKGQQSPLFFGSAMTNFGVELFLKTFLEYAQTPVGRQAVVESNDPTADTSSLMGEDDNSVSLLHS